MMNMKITFSISYVRITVDTAYEDDHQVKMDDDLQKNFLSAIGDPSKGNLKPFRYIFLAQFSILHFLRLSQHSLRPFEGFYWFI